jgi:AcrR family transcriptional regulator
MNEIAGDISMSKALLYYYFPDKSELYVAVMRKLSSDYLKLLTDHKLDNLKDVFIFQVNTHHEFIVRNYNFFDYFRLNEQNLPDTIWGIVEQIRQAESYLLVNAIKAEEAKGEIKPLDNPEEFVDLLLDALQGVRVGAQSHKKARFPRIEHLDEIHAKRLMLIDIFIKGLKY